MFLTASAPSFALSSSAFLSSSHSLLAAETKAYSPQQSLTFYLDEANEAGSTIRISDSAGNEIISGTSNKRFNWICISTESLTEGETYTLFINETETVNITANGGFASTGTRSGGFGGFGGERPEGNFGRRQKQ